MTTSTPGGASGGGGTARRNASPPIYYVGGSPGKKRIGVSTEFLSTRLQTSKIMVCISKSKTF